MRRLIFIIFLFCISAGFANFFDIGTVNQIRISFSQANWDEILDSLYAAGNDERLVGNAVINGIAFDSVGVRYKGHSSYNPSRRKNPFNIKLDYIHAGRQIEGHGTLRLANVYKDPSFVREVLSYEIARKYMPAGLSNFSTIYVNDILIGLYANNEDVDKLFMRMFYYCDENARFKGQSINDSVAMQDWKYLGPDSTPYMNYFERESDSARHWQSLINFLDTLNNYTGSIEKVLNVDQLLWMLAFDVLFVNLDAPINTAQNYYLYQDASGRFNPIIWDLNENFGAYRDLKGTGQLTVAQMQQLSPFLRATDTNYPIASKVLSNARYRKMYVSHMKTIIQQVLANNWYQERAVEIQNIIDNYVQTDPNKFYSYNDFINNITRSIGSGPLAIVGLTQLMNTRVSYILSQTEFQAAAPEISITNYMPNQVSPNSNVRFLVRVSGADSVFLEFRQNPGFRFQKKVMYDDGQHGDSLAGDGLYGTTVQIGAGDINYYFYAENSQAASFSPARAEKEFITIATSGGVVINELLAINNSTIQDPMGQYDDCIELYNNTSNSISLDGFLLSDDSTNIIKWQFPDISIPSHAHMLIWADNDLNQPGLHANFKLPGSGGVLVLSNDDGYIIDRVVYGPQSADTSFGRFPNGIGSFVIMHPTFGFINTSGLGLTQIINAPSVKILEGAYPNPFILSTSIRYNLPEQTKVVLQIYNAVGRVVATLVNQEQNPGNYLINFAPQNTNLAQGVYFIRLVASGINKTNSVESIKIIFTK